MKFGTFVGAAALLLAAGAAHAAKINVSAPVDGVVTVSLDAEGAEIAGTENLLTFDGGLRVAAKANGKPNCTVNEDIDKGATSFAFQPSGCSGEACERVKALVLSLENVNPIPDGSVLYTCVVTGEGTLGCDAPGASDPAGNPVVTTCGGGGEETPTPEPTPPAGPRINVSAPVNGTITVSLSTAGEEIAGTENVLQMGAVQIAARPNGKPNCSVNEEIDKAATSFAYQPSGCTPGDTCTAVKALVLSLENVNPIPDGSVLYTCVVTGEGSLECTNPGASDPAGNPIEITCGAPPALPTPTPTNTVEVPTNTPTTAPTNTNTAPPAPTSTNTRTPRPARGDDEDDGCQVTAPANSTGLLLLLPAVGLLIARRRSR